MKLKILLSIHSVFTLSLDYDFTYSVWLIQYTLVDNVMTQKIAWLYQSEIVKFIALYIVYFYLITYKIL